MPQHGQAVGARHHKVREYQIEVELIDNRYSGIAVRGLVYFEAFPAQQLCEALARTLLIFNDEDRSAHDVSPPRSYGWENCRAIFSRLR
jgi:hypothetical protein